MTDPTTSDRELVALYDKTFDTVLDKPASITVAEAAAVRAVYDRGVADAVERAAQESDRGYLASENCDDIAARIRAIPTTPTPEGALA